MCLYRVQGSAICLSFNYRKKNIEFAAYYSATETGSPFLSPIPASSEAPASAASDVSAVASAIGSGIQTKTRARDCVKEKKYAARSSCNVLNSPSRVRTGVLEQRHEQELQDDAQQQRLRVEVSVEHQFELGCGFSCLLLHSP